MEIPRFNFTWNMADWDKHCPLCGRFASYDNFGAWCKCGWKAKDGEPVLIVTNDIKDNVMDRIYLKDM